MKWKKKKCVNITVKTTGELQNVETNWLESKEECEVCISISETITSVVYAAQRELYLWHSKSFLGKKYITVLGSPIISRGVVSDTPLGYSVRGGTKAIGYIRYKDKCVIGEIQSREQWQAGWWTEELKVKKRSRWLVGSW